MRRYSVMALLTAFVTVSVIVARQPEQAKACPVCVVAGGIGLYEIATVTLGAGVIGGGSYYTIHHAINNSESKAREVANHPLANSGTLAKMRAWRHAGAQIWNAHPSLSKVWRYVRNHASLQRIKNRMPDAAWACGVMGILSYLMNGSLTDAAHACLGAAVGAVFFGSKVASPVAVQ